MKSRIHALVPAVLLAAMCASGMAAPAAPKAPGKSPRPAGRAAGPSKPAPSKPRATPPAAPHAAPATGTLKAPYDEFTLALMPWNGSGMVSVTGKDGVAAVAPGDYWIAGWSVRKKDGEGHMWRADGGSQGQPTMGARIRSGASAEVRVATPIGAILSVDQADNQFSFVMQFQGASGDRCTRVYRDGENPPVPKLKIADADGATVAVLDFKYG